MAAGTQVTTLSDFRTELLNATREQTGLSALNTIADRYINISLADMHHNHVYPWAVREAVLITQPSYSTGTVTITKGATALTGASTAWTTNNSFGVANARTTGKIVIGSNTDVYEITTVGGATSITLASRFTGADVSAGSYTYFEDDYALASDFFRPVDWRSFSTDRRIGIVQQREFYARFARNSTTGKPTCATLVDKPFSGSTARVQRVRFAPAPDDAYSIPYRYITTSLASSSTGTAQTELTADTDEPIIPLRYRHLLLTNALYHWFLYRKNDTRAAEVRAEYDRLKAKLDADTGLTESRARIEFRTPNFNNRRRYRTGGYATGTWFDELKDIR